MQFPTPRIQDGSFQIATLKQGTKPITCILVSPIGPVLGLVLARHEIDAKFVSEGDEIPPGVTVALGETSEALKEGDREDAPKRAA